MSDRKAVIKNADMSEEMQQDAVDSATQAMEKFNIEKVSAQLNGNVRKGGAQHDMPVCCVLANSHSNNKSCDESFSLCLRHGAQIV